MPPKSRDSEPLDVIKTIRLTKAEVTAIKKATVKRVSELGELMSISDFIRAAIHASLERDQRTKTKK